MDIILASHNKNKIKELKDLLSDSCFTGVSVKSLSDIGFFDEIEEKGSSFEENAMIKATALKRDDAIIVSDDSGLCVNALNGAPGVYSARYSGEGATYKSNNELLLKNMEGAADRSATFVTVVACVLPDGSSFTVRGERPGIILDSLRGEGGFGYDPLFYIPEMGKTFAELSPEEKNAVSHRGMAMRAFVKRLKSIFGRDEAEMTKQ